MRTTAKAPANNRCIFCGSSPVTKEDIYSKWIIKILKREFSWEGGRAGFKSESRGNEWLPNRPLEMVVKCVCRTCNNGWMSEIESAARPPLARMIRGEESIELDMTAQIAIGTWACLKTMIGAYVWTDQPIAGDWLEHVYRERRPPAGWHVFTTRYTGRLGQMADTHRFSVGIAGAGLKFMTSPEEEGVLTSLIIGRLAIHSRGVREPKGMKVGSNLLKIWPPSPLILIWPPPIEVADGDSLESFRRIGFDASSSSFDLPPEVSNG